MPWGSTALPLPRLTEPAPGAGVAPPFFCPPGLCFLVRRTGQPSRAQAMAHSSPSPGVRTAPQDSWSSSAHSAQDCLCVPFRTVCSDSPALPCAKESRGCFSFGMGESQDPPASHTLSGARNDPGTSDSPVQASCEGLPVPSHHPHGPGAQPAPHSSPSPSSNKCPLQPLPHCRACLVSLQDRQLQVTQTTRNTGSGQTNSTTQGLLPYLPSWCEVTEQLETK